MENKRIFAILLILLVLSFLANAVTAFMYFKASKALVSQNGKMAETAKLLLFRNLFTENIILSEKSVEFETRLKMEEAARALNDPEIFSLWQSFTKSQTGEEVNSRAKALLNLLIKKTNGNL